MTSIGTRQHQSSGESATPGRQRKLALSWIKDSLASTPDGTGRRGGARNPQKTGLGRARLAGTLVAKTAWRLASSSAERRAAAGATSADDPMRSRSSLAEEDSQWQS
jgi:hypothetical protein